VDDDVDSAIDYGCGCGRWYKQVGGGRIQRCGANEGDGMGEEEESGMCVMVWG